MVYCFLDGVVIFVVFEIDIVYWCLFVLFSCRDSCYDVIFFGVVGFI